MSDAARTSTKVSSERHLLHFIPSFPSPDDPNLEREIVRLKTLYELRLSPGESRKENAGELLNHQLYMAALFSDASKFREGLMWHGIGTGKTCLVSAIVEHLKKSKQKLGLSYRPALVVVLNEDLERNFKREVSEVCTNLIYLPTFQKASEEKAGTMSDQAYSVRLNRNIATTYEIKTLEAFAKELSSRDDASIMKEFSYRDIFLDEAHAIHQVAGDKSVYEQYHRFFHIITGGRRILLTGTPVWDSVHEFADLMNLILPLDEQLPTGAAFMSTFFRDDKLINKKRLVQAIRGRVFHVRAMQTSTRIIEMGVREPWMEHVTVYPDVMSAYQSKIVKKVQSSSQEAGVVYRNARHAATLVFPGGGYDTEAFERFVVKKRVRQRWVYEFADKSLGDELVNNLQKYSAKTYEIISSIISNPQELCYVFNDFVTGPGGVIVFCLILQGMGYQWVRNESDIKGKGKRFMAITADSAATDGSAQVRKLLDIHTSPENKYGEIMQIVVGSEKISIGLTLKNIRQIHLSRPYWNFSEPDQAGGRARRFSSQDDLPKNEQYTKTFLHVAAFPGKDVTVKNASGVQHSASLEETVDMKVLQMAYNKDLQTSQVYRLAKINAVDCALAYRRNVLSTDVNGSRECNYDKCSYQCSGFTPEEMKDLIERGVPEEALNTAGIADVSKGWRAKYRDTVLELLQKKGVVSLEEIVEATGARNDMYTLLETLEHMLDERDSVIDDYGFEWHIKEANDVYYLGWDFSNSGNITDSIYVENRPLEVMQSLLAVVENMEKEDVVGVKRYCAEPSMETLSSIQYVSQIIMLEMVVAYVIRVLKKTPETKTGIPLLDVILGKYGSEVYEIEKVWVHDLYASQHRGISHNVSSRKVKVTGTLRVYDPTTDTWDNTSQAQEESYLRAIKNAKRDEIENLFVNNPYNLVAVMYSTDKHYRIVIKGRGNKGLVIENHSKAAFLNLFLNYMKELPPPEEVYSKARVIRKIQEELEKAKNDDLEKVIGDTSQYDRETLNGILNVITTESKKLVSWTKRWLKDHKLAVRL